MLLARRLSVLAVVGILVTTVGNAADPERFGAGVTLNDATPMPALMANPAAFEGKTVRIDGTVTAVCEHKGCWMSFAPTDVPQGATFLVKVDDDVIVFPVTAKGRRASAQGVIQRVPGNPEAQEAANEHARHTAGAAPAGTPAPAPVAWQLKATGAMVY